MGLHIVLVEPEIPQNTGNIARTCVALGASLHLIHPLGFSLSEKQVKRAGLDYWPYLRVVEYPHQAAFLEQHQHKSLWFCTTKASHIYSEVSFEQECYCVFGKESAGLDEHLLIAHQERCIRIPMRSEARSLNLSNSVAIIAYEWGRQHQFINLQREGSLHRLQWPTATQ